MKYQVGDIITWPKDPNLILYEVIVACDDTDLYYLKRNGQHLGWYSNIEPFTVLMIRKEDEEEEII